MPSLPFGFGRSIDVIAGPLACLLAGAATNPEDAAAKVAEARA